MADIRLSWSANAVRSSAIRDLLAVANRPGVLSLAGGLPAPEHFPRERIGAAHSRAFAEPNALQYTESAGLPQCRRAVAAYESVSDEQVLLTHGSQQGLALLANALINPGDVVVVDDPVYVGALQAFSAAQADIRAIPITSTGIDTSLLQHWCEEGLRPVVVHTVATFHNPGGVSADIERRRHLAELANTYQFWVIDDDPYRRLRFRGDPMSPLRTFSNRVIAVGSVSKILAPALRVGWIIADPELLAVVERLRQSTDLCGSALAHWVVADLLADNVWLDRHISTVSQAYAERADALCDSLATEFDKCAVTRPDGGMFTWIRLPGINTHELLPLAVDEGVAFVPGNAFAVAADFSDCLRLSFATCPSDQLVIAVQRLARATCRACS